MASKGIVTFDEAMCKGCELCVNECPHEVLDMGNSVNDKGYLFPKVAKADNCTGCTNCAVICPDSVITVYREKRAKKTT